jgi:hypothetical protein
MPLEQKANALAERRLGIIVNGATGGLARHQHLAAVLALRAEGGLMSSKASGSSRISGRRFAQPRGRARRPRAHDTPEAMKTFVDVVDCPKEMWLYEGVFHPMGEVAGEVNADIAGSILDALNKGVPAGYKRMVIVPER